MTLIWGYVLNAIDVERFQGFNLARVIHEAE